MKKWWIMVATVMAAVVILAVCIYGLPVEPPAIFPSDTTGSLSSTGNSQSGTTLPPETPEETLPWRPGDPISYKSEDWPGMSPVGDYEINRQILPETVENPDGLPVLKWVCIFDRRKNVSNQIWNEAAVVELNQMLADRDLPYRVQFTILTAKALVEPRDLFANPEIQKELEDADLIFGNYTATEMEQLLLPITEYIYGDAQPSLVGALPDPLCWFSYEAGGDIYGIPDRVALLYTQGMSIDSSFMEKCDLTVEDFNQDFCEMEDLFAKIYEKNGNEPFIKDQYFGSFLGTHLWNSVIAYLPMNDALNHPDYQEICLNFSIDLQAEKPTVVNMLETELFTKTLDAALRYVKAEYISDEYNEIRQEGTIFEVESYYDDSTERYMIPYGSVGLRILNYAYMTGISAKSSHQEQALSLLEQIMTDDALRLQLCYGKEGRDYTLEEGNVYSLTTQEDGSCYFMDFLSPQAAFFEFTAADEDTGWLVYSTSGGGIKKREGMTRLESYKELLAQVSISHCPAIFDYSVIDAELTAIGKVQGEYYPMFMYEELYLEEYYPEMLEKMEEAGMSTVIAELQRQLDAWIAEHPDWDPLS